LTSGAGIKRVGGTHLRVEFGVDKFPVLQRWQMWCKRAERRAGAAGAIDDRERGQCG
jgi:hypothetical protein